MKTTRLIAIALILGISSLGFAQTKTTAPDPDAQSMVIQLKKALHNRTLVNAMKAQLNPRFLQEDKPSYTVAVRYSHKIVYVNGTYNEWKRFFGSKLDEDSQIAKSGLIQLPNAMRDRNLVQAMKAQLTPRILKTDKQYIVAPVRYKHTIVYIGGTYSQWVKFFGMAPHGDPED